MKVFNSKQEGKRCKEKWKTASREKKRRKINMRNGRKNKEKIKSKRMNKFSKIKVIENCKI